MKIDAEKQFTPSHERIAEILESYDLQLVAYKSAQSGIENCTLFVDTSKGNYVLRIYRQDKKTNEAIIAEFDFVQYLSKHAIPVAPAIKNLNGHYVTYYSEWQAILMLYVGGTHAALYDTDLIMQLATTQANMHLLAATYTTPPALQRRLTILKDTYFLPKVDMTTVCSEAQPLLDRAARYAVTLPSGLPAGVCHMDYDVNNILVNDNHDIAAVLDFDDATLAPFAACLGYTLWDIMSQEDKGLVDDYLAIYMSVRSMTKAELDIIGSVMLFRHYMITALIALDGDMDAETASRYARVENKILDWKIS